MLFKEIITVYSENYIKQIQFVGKMQNYCLLKLVVHTVTSVN